MLSSQSASSSKKPKNDATKKAKSAAGHDIIAQLLQQRDNTLDLGQDDEFELVNFVEDEVIHQPPAQAQTPPQKPPSPPPAHKLPTPKQASPQHKLPVLHKKPSAPAYGSPAPAQKPPTPSQKPPAPADKPPQHQPAAQASPQQRPPARLQPDELIRVYAQLAAIML
ncbi:hypothetical protein BSL78_09704 [Apostichopus japonicus]|uniref:Uncharacterized protein n=1 Tax=Stichopus japonicus TaxID=307972 RepID=A0A2G8KZK2_STIJA|nr:hypothetical protein BSL78_09704 [Apostichopus japonicus]